jgi:Type I phosphodiesterase / nucleotide pyrophosphatase
MVVVLLVGSTVAVAAGFFESSDEDGASPSPPADTPSPSRTGASRPPPPPPRRAYLRAACQLPTRWVERIHRGWSPGRTRDSDLVIVPEPPNFMGSPINASHSGPYDFLQEVPLVLYGPGFVRPVGPVELDREVTIADLAPTYAELMRFDAWPNRRGSDVLSEILEDTDETPKLIFTVVIDGGGWNVFDHWSDRHPNLSAIAERGAGVEGAIVGSSPSITPATHTNLSTGVFPRTHGVTAIAVRNEAGQIVGAFSEEAGNPGSRAMDPRVSLQKTTIADLWDRSVRGRAEIGMLSRGNLMLGMIGHGAALKGGDKDIVALLAGDEWSTNDEFFSLPSYINTEVEGPEGDIDAVDRSDGEADGRWQGHEVAPLDGSPAFAPWQNRVVQALLEREGFGADETTDLFYLNYKAPDRAGHTWNMVAPEQGDVVESVDQALGEMVDWLDSHVGRGEYVMAITGDHGQTPLEAGGWPISRSEIAEDIDAQFKRVEGDNIIQRTSASSFFSNPASMEANGTSPEEVSSFLSRYTIKDNIPEGESPPEEFADRVDERIFAAVFPGGKLDRVVRCAEAGRL